LLPIVGSSEGIGRIAAAAVVMGLMFGIDAKHESVLRRASIGRNPAGTGDHQKEHP